MSANTSIEWTDHTMNPWWGCSKVSPGCVHCYAETWAKRTGHGGTWGVKGERRKFGEKHWAEPLKWNRQAEAEGQAQRVFCASMADVFEDHPALPEERGRLWRLIEDTPHLDWQLLTKRPENIARMVPPSWLEEPRENVWYGTSVATQEWADKRIPVLLDIPAAVRFISAEPLLGPVDLTRIRAPLCDPRDALAGGFRDSSGDLYELGQHARLDWVIVGGESGPGARPMNIHWARSIVEQCQEAGVAAFVKQLGSVPYGLAPQEDDEGWTWPAPVDPDWSGDDVGAYRPKLRDSKGGDPDEWPVCLRVRQMPENTYVSPKGQRHCKACRRIRERRRSRRRG